MTGCNDLLACDGVCGDTTCTTNCYNNATSLGQSLFNTFYACLTTACKSALPTDPCSTSNPNYQTTCAACENGSVVGTGCNSATGAGCCSSQYAACTANTP
jgi:hypothetical protein